MRFFSTLLILSPLRAMRRVRSPYPRQFFLGRDASTPNEFARDLVLRSA